MLELRGEILGERNSKSCRGEAERVLKGRIIPVVRSIREENNNLN